MLGRARKMTEEREGGFTLIEVLIVVTVIGILAAIAIPIYLNQRSKGYEAAAKSDLNNLARFEEVYLNDHGRYGTIAEINAPTDSGGAVKVSKGDTVEVVRYDSLNGYCLSATHPGSGGTLYFDSQAGGLQLPAGTTCPKTTTGTAGDSLSNP